MRTAKACRRYGWLRRAAAALLSLAAVSAPGIPGEAALITGSYKLEYNGDVTKTGTEKEEIRRIKQTIDLGYRGLLSPVVEHEAKFKLETESEVNSGAADTTRLLPTLDLLFKGRYWDLNAGVKRTRESSDEPGKNPKTTVNWFVEFFYMAPSRVPDLKAKYTLDTDYEAGTTDTREQGIDLSSVYRPNDWLNVKGQYTRDTREDRLHPDSDTEEEKTNATAGIRRVISSKVRAEAEYSLETTRGATLLDAGGTTNDKQEQTHKVKTLVTFRPFRDTSIDGSYDYELKQDLVLGEHTLTTNIKSSAAQRIGEPFTVKGEFNRVITESRHTVDDNTKTEDTWTVDVAARFSKQLDFTAKHQDKHSVEDHVDVTKSQVTSTVTDSATWTGELAPFWKASASYDRTDNYTWDPVARQEVKTAIDTKYSIKTTLDFKAIHLTIDPSYDITLTEDRIKPEDSATRDFKCKLAYDVPLTRTVLAKVDHTYGRKVDTGAGNIQRTDSTNGNVTWNNPLPGWIVTVDLTRQATDTSEDDLPAEITSTFGFKIDYKYRWLEMNTSYKYDKKSLTDDGETFDAKVGWTAPRWDLALTYNFTKVFSVQLDEKYSVTLSFTYNL